MAKSTVTQDVIRDALRDLAQARDDARLQAHLFSLDARQRWSELETTLQNLEYRIGAGGNRAAEAAAATVREMTRAVREFLDRHGRHSTEHTPAKAIMSPAVRACSPNDNLAAAAKIMWEANCGVVPVVDGQGKLAGMLTDRDICMSAYLSGEPIWKVSVSNAMSKEVFSCSTEDSVDRVLDVMRQRQVRRVPVVDAESRLVGIVALADVARYVQSLADSSAASRRLLDALAGISDPSSSGANTAAAAQ
jgi:CBS domain-containing protein